MKEVWKYIPELAPSRVKKNLTRWWRINVNPPKESKIFVKPEEVKEVGVLLDSIKTKEQPKQLKTFATGITIDMLQMTSKMPTE